MVNDNETVNLNQKRYEENIQERYKFIVEKKAMIERMSDNSILKIENMEF
jgi:hypothetical protein